MIRRSILTSASVLLSCLSMTACGDASSDEDNGDTESETGNNPESTAGPTTMTDPTVADDTMGDSTDDPTVDPTTDPDSTGGDPNPAIVLAERVFLPEGRFYYLSVVAEVPSAPVDRSQALEFSSADVEVFEEGVYVRDRESNTMTRYTVSEDLELIQDVQFSFQGTGLGTGRVYNAYVSPTRAFALDAVGWRMIEWNPTEMILTGEEIALTGYAKKGLIDGAIGKPRRVGDRVVAQVSWNDYENLVTNPGVGAMLITDDGTAVPELVEDGRVGGGFAIYGDEAGNTYAPGITGGDIVLFGSVLGGGPVPPSGVVRIPAGATEFDADYFVDVTEISGTPGGVWAIHRIDDTHLLVQLWDPETPVDGITIPDDYYAASEFVYGIIDTEAETFTAVDSIPKGGIGNSLDHRVDGELYVQTTIDLGNDESEASVHRVTPTGTEEAFRVPGGDLWHLERVR